MIPVYKNIQEWNMYGPYPTEDNICWISKFLYYYKDKPPIIDRYIDDERIVNIVKQEEKRNCGCRPEVNVYCDVHNIISEIKRVVTEELG